MSQAQKPKSFMQSTDAHLKIFKSYKWAISECYNSMSRQKTTTNNKTTSNKTIHDSYLFIPIKCYQSG